VVGLTLVVPAALAAFVLARIVLLGLGFHGEIASLEPRIARLRGTMQAEKRLVDAAAKAGSRIENLIYPAGGDLDTVTATLQKNVRSIMSRAGLEVADSQIKPATREGAFDVIGLTVSGAGSIEALDMALNEIVSSSPLLLVTAITVTPRATARRREAGPEDQQTLSVKMSLQALVGVE
jgi:general secretion pathway protein M